MVSYYISYSLEHTNVVCRHVCFPIYTLEEEELMFRAAWLLGKTRRTAKYNDGSITKTNLYL